MQVLVNARGEFLKRHERHENDMQALAKVLGEHENDTRSYETQEYATKTPRKRMEYALNATK